jgi:hypothetical protein
VTCFGHYTWPFSDSLCKFMKRMHKHMMPCILTKILRSCDRVLWRILIIKPTRCTNFSNLFLEMKLHKFQTVPVSIISSYSLCTQQWYMLYRFVDSFRAAAGSGWNFFIAALMVITVTFFDMLIYCSKAVYRPVWHITLLCVQWETPDDGPRNCPKHVEIHSKINLRN